MNEIKTQISVIIEGFGANPKSNVPIHKQLNSLNLVELIIKLEKAFQIEISPMDYDPSQFNSLESIALLIKNKREA
jgi:acyl carrier protein